MLVVTDNKLKDDPRCAVCLHRTFQRLMDRFQIETNIRQKFESVFKQLLAEKKGMTTPQLHRELNKYFQTLFSIEDPYADEKRHSNEVALELYQHWRPRVIASVNVFEKALRLAIAGNIMDYGPGADFDIHKTIDSVMNREFAINHVRALQSRVKSAGKVLYLGDNAGEIVFDKLFIEIMMHQNLTYAVRGSAVLNDATLDDVEQVGMDAVADVISNGYDASSTVLDHCSPEFLQVYREADVIISKGQGNLEGLLDENDPRIFFLLMIKCDVVAERLQVPAGSFVVYNTGLHRERKPNKVSS